MASIDVLAEGEDEYRVTVADDDGSTSTHVVTASSEDAARHGAADPEGLIEASFRFLLDREPKESILGRFELPVIARYFPEYPDRIGDYLR